MGGWFDDFIDNTIDALDDIGDSIGDVLEDTYKEVIQPALDFGVDLTADFVEANLDAIDYVGSAFGVDDITGSLHDINEGVRYLSHESLDGNWKAAATLGVLVASVYLAVISGGAAFSTTMSILGSLGLGGTAGVIVGYTIMGAIIVSSIMSIYGVALSLEAIGKYANNPNALMRMAQQMRDSMNLAFTNAWINGSMNLWRAGGLLYDAPRAGDLKFNVTGNMNTVKFLNIQDQNKSTWMDWSEGKYHNFHRKNFGNMAGDEFFSVAPMA